MKPRKAKTARFSAVVETAGQPEVASLWTPPEQDKAFMAAVRQNRVLTVEQEPGASRKDYGEVGFTSGKHKTYLIFPKPLKAFKEQRIVGIRYDLLKPPAPMGRVVRPERAGSSGRHTAKEARSKTLKSAETPAVRAKDKAFRVTTRFTAVMDVPQVIRAASRNAARQRAERHAAVPDMSRATITRKVMGISLAD